MSHPFKHFKTVTQHRHQVIRHCFKAGIPLQGLVHDLSKYSPAEFIPGARYWAGNKSPHVEERKEFGFSKAWMHHKGRNKHHFEYWTDYVPGSHGLVGVNMPTRYLVEMFCDRVAATKIYNGKGYLPSQPLEYYERAKGRYVIHPETADTLEALLTMLKDKGEDITFQYIRTELLKH